MYARRASALGGIHKIFCNRRQVTLEEFKKVMQVSKDAKAKQEA